MKIPTVAILFDLDGTLLDSALDFTYCMDLLLEQEGKQPIRLEDLRRTVTFGVKGMIKFGFKLSEQDPAIQSLSQRFEALYLQNVGIYCQLFPGINAILTSLCQNNIPWGIVTNKHQKYTYPLLEKFNVLKKAGCVVTGDCFPTPKPDPNPLLHAARALKVLARNSWYVGDALTDVQASRNANMRAAIATYGYIPENENPRNWQADVYFEKAKDIKRILFPAP